MMMKIVSSSMISVGLMTVLIVLLIQASGGFAFLASPTLPFHSKPCRYPHPPEYSSLFSSVAVSVDELEKDLTPAEKSITSVVRKCGPSVAYVTSVWPTPTTTSAGNSSSSSRKRKEGEGQNRRPSGRELGSGSGFQVSSDGYICTNYHVVERAYTIQQAYSNFETMIQQIAGNVTTFLPKDLVDSVLQSTMTSLNNSNGAPVVSVRINSETQYQTCRIVSVEPDLDLALLKVESPAADDNKSFISFGSSSELLVGQSVVAIGNPFALDKTVTTGVVSAVNREFRGAGTARTPANTPIRNCIQTDAAINPGNSGGPLLNLRGQVVGINTAIITTSGSNAGIGFAVPSDQLQPVVDRMIQKDRMTSRRDVGWLGINIAKQPIHKSTTKVYVAEVAKGSPAKFAGIQPLQIQTNGSIKLGDAIVAVSGNEVTSLDELQAQLKNRVEGEQISLTLENSAGEKRVVYIKLGQKP